ncbi:MAG: hypothetical protein DCC75_07115 [Proteobacteria bacterium]|nr:MAG: hypothetical protein DCC75_07115 [Pseudomonadota bacterium]
MPRSSRQSGLVIIWAVLLAPVLLAIAALAIDISLHLVRQHDAKKAADAAAIAASQSFNGSLQGWRDAKRAALAALKNAKVTGYGVLSDLRPLGVLNCTSDEAALDPLELSVRNAHESAPP